MDEIDEMCRIIWEALAMGLTSVPGKDKQLDRTDECLDTFGETPDFASQLSLRGGEKFQRH